MILCGSMLDTELTEIMKVDPVRYVLFIG